MTARDPGQTSSRKLDHLRICAGRPVAWGDPGFDEVRFVHQALPEVDMDRIDLSAGFLGRRFELPLFIAAMTGGHPDTTEVNRRLASAAEHYGIGIGVGSQRAALEDPALEPSFSVVREAAPRAFVAANLGVVQLRDHGPEWAERAIEMISADAIAIHLNFLQEAIQHEGDHNAEGCLAALCSLCEEFKYPVIVKETGSGISAETAALLWDAGVAAIDVGGWGGTSWAVVEGIRAEEHGQNGRRLTGLGDCLAEWGIPTIVSLVESCGRGPVIATGGVRSGIDIAKAIRLGADLGGMALALLGPAIESEDALTDAVDLVRLQLRAAMFLTGSRSIGELKDKRVYIMGTTRRMIGKRRERYNGY